MTKRKQGGCPSRHGCESEGESVSEQSEGVCPGHCHSPPRATASRPPTTAGGALPSPSAATQPGLDLSLNLRQRRYCFLTSVSGPGSGSRRTPVRSQHLALCGRHGHAHIPPHSHTHTHSHARAHTHTHPLSSPSERISHDGLHMLKSSQNPPSLRRPLSRHHGGGKPMSPRCHRVVDTGPV